MKSHEYLKNKASVLIPRYIPTDPDNKTKYLVFCKMYKGKVDAYRGEAVDFNSPIAKYLQDAMALQTKPIETRLKFYFSHLESPDWSVSADALREFAVADYKDVAKVAANFSPDQLLKWLRDPNTSSVRYGLYGMLLGHAGTWEKHGSALKKMLDDPKVREASGFDGLLAGFILLNKQSGMKYAKDLLYDTKNEYLLRYAVMRGLKFFQDYRQDIISRTEVVEVLTPLLDQEDLSDLVIEEFRRQEVWSLAGQIVQYFDKEGFDVPLIQRSIMRYALAAPGDCWPAVELLERMRSDVDSKEILDDIENILELEMKSSSIPSSE
ncbi:MAG: hypothetical protein R3B84_06220 [Zavarzinella sp.]